MSDRSNEHRPPDGPRDHAAGPAVPTEAQPAPSKREKARMVAVQAGAYAMMVPWG